MGNRNTERDRLENRRRQIGRNATLPADSSSVEEVPFAAVEGQTITAEALGPRTAGAQGAAARLRQLTASPPSPATAGAGSGALVPVRFALHRGKTPIAKLIRWQTRSKYSHASLVDPDGWLWEAREFRGVVHERRIEDCGDDLGLFAVWVAVPVAAELWAWCRSQAGKRYDYTMIIRFLSRQRETTGSKQRWFCSEFVYAAFEAAGVDLFEETEAWQVPPDWLRRSKLVRRGAFVRNGRWMEFATADTA